MVNISEMDSGQRVPSSTSLKRITEGRNTKKLHTKVCDIPYVIRPISYYVYNFGENRRNFLNNVSIRMRKPEITVLGCPGVLSNGHNSKGHGPFFFGFFDKLCKIVYSIE